MTTTSVNVASSKRIAINFSAENVQTVVFLTQLEFRDLMVKMYDFGKANM